MGVALKDLKGKVKRPVRSVSVCLDGELWDRHDELTRKLDVSAHKFSQAARDKIAAQGGTVQEIG